MDIRETGVREFHLVFGIRERQSLAPKREIKSVASLSGNSTDLFSFADTPKEVPRGWWNLFQGFGAIDNQNASRWTPAEASGNTRMVDR